MSRIKLEKSWKYAIGGNKVVEFPAGVHQVTDAVAKIALDEAKVATAVAADSKDPVLPALECDSLGNELTESDLEHLGGLVKKPKKQD